MNSGLLFTDAKVDAAEVSQSKLKFEEVVLSACSTGWRPTEVEGANIRGDEILGIPAGFLEAGARTVLVSITKAEVEASRHFCVTYHRFRASGLSPIKAFQMTQMDLLETGTLHPSVWAGFALYGCS